VRLIGVNEIKLTGMPPEPQMGVNEENEALASVPEILAVVKSDGVAETDTAPAVDTSPLLFVPEAVDGCSVHRPEINLATLISASPLMVTSGVRSLCGSQPILILAETAEGDETVQYSRVFVTSSGGAMDVAVIFGEKNSAVKDVVTPAAEVSVNL
jgi:hypothetical protein